MRSWKNLSWVALLSVLQCITPLVHAHVGGDFHSGSVHFHLNGDILNHNDAATTKPELSDIQSEFPVIGIAQGHKNDYILFLTGSHGPSHTGLLASVLNPISLANIGQTKQIFFRFSYCHPPAQAPPTLSSNK
ncbi:MAG: hypothetical protein DID90_2727553243 [Candidatus Nitrotoga sp. LAW]|nr:MAG: hypothetical protein DID90_2727553243 [Candidatus Nitrotoga sp. LAW]